MSLIENNLEMLKEYLNTRDKNIIDKILIINKTRILGFIRIQLKKFGISEDCAEEYFSSACISIIEKLRKMTSYKGDASSFNRGLRIWVTRAVEADIKKEIMIDKRFISYDNNRDLEQENIEMLDYSIECIEDLLTRESIKKECIEILGSLKEQERKYISLYFGFGNKKVDTMEKIAEIDGVSKSYVSAVIKNGLKKIKPMILKSNGIDFDSEDYDGKPNNLRYIK